VSFSYQHRTKRKSRREEEKKRRREEYARLGADLERDTAMGALRVVYRLGTSLDVWAHTMIVARRERFEVVEPEERDGILGRAVANGGSVLSDVALCDVVGSLSAEKESIPT
jgi:hypothetical protein